MTPQKITPFLWFDGNAEEAAKFYVSIFKNSKVKSVSRMGKGEGEGRKKAPVVVVVFELEGQKFMALNGGPKYAFSPAISLFVGCRTQKEIDRLWKRLTSGGGSPEPCGWLRDKYGVSWQNIPEDLPKLLKAPGAVQAMLTMTKLDIAALKKVGRAKPTK